MKENEMVIQSCHSDKTIPPRHLRRGCPGAAQKRLQISLRLSCSPSRPLTMRVLRLTTPGASSLFGSARR